MENTTAPRWLLLIWLIASQIGTLLLIFVPVSIIFTVGLLAMEEGGMPFLFLLGCGSGLLPFASAVGAWIAFVRRKDKIAAALSGICLLLGVVLYFAMDAFTRYMNP